MTSLKLIIKPYPQAKTLENNNNSYILTIFLKEMFT
jgi:hypothetical protein